MSRIKIKKMSRSTIKMFPERFAILYCEKKFFNENTVA